MSRSQCLSENSPGCESSSTLFHCGIILSPVCLCTHILLLLTLIYHCDHQTHQQTDFFITHCEILVFLSPLPVFVLVSLLGCLTLSVLWDSTMTAFFWLDDCWLDSCVVYQMNSVSDEAHFGSVWLCFGYNWSSFRKVVLSYIHWCRRNFWS